MIITITATTLITKKKILLLHLSIDVPEEDDSTCSVCLDGSEPVSSNTPFSNTTTTTSLTCNDLISTALTVTEGSKECEEIQLAGFQGNCCDGSSYLVTPESFDRCAFCPKGEGATFLPFKEVPTRSGTVVTCSDLSTNTDIIAEFLREYIESPGDCEDTALRRSAAWCGCSGTTIECEFSCSGDNPVDVERTHPLTGMSCQEIIFQFSLLNDEQCPNAGLYLQFDPTALCCPSPETEPDSSLISCPICTNTQEFTMDKTVMTEEFSEVTCGDAQSAANLLLSDQVCTDLRKTFSQSCCVENPTENESISTCELKCPTTGELPTDLSREDPDTGYTCNDLIAEYANLTAVQCSNASSIVGFDAISFCCENIEDEEPSESTSLPVPNVPEDRYDCRVCPPKQRLLYPGRVLFAYNELTCSEVEETASSIFDDSACFSLLDESRALSNCICRNEQDGGINEDENGETVVEIIGSGSTRPKLWDVKGWNVNAVALLYVLFYVII